ncbi:MAG: ABC-2 family transporter protein [Chloroherpetonaceae bacterium]
MKKYFFVYRTSLQRFVEYRGEILMDISGKILLPIFVQSILWRAVIESTPDGQIAGYTYEAMFQYVVLSILIANFVKVDSVERQISNAIKDGTLNKFLAQPVDFALYNLMTFFADSTPVLLGGAIVYGVMLWTGFVSATAFQILSGMLVLLFGLFISFLLAFMIAALAFYMDEVWTLFVMKNMSMWFLTGQVIPLDMFPESVARVLKFLPFGYLAFVPTKIFTGAFSTQEILFALSVVFCWTLGLYLLYKIFWTYSLRQYSAFGG